MAFDFMMRKYRSKTESIAPLIFSGALLNVIQKFSEEFAAKWLRSCRYKQIFDECQNKALTYDSFALIKTSNAKTNAAMTASMRIMRRATLMMNVRCCLLCLRDSNI